MTATIKRDPKSGRVTARDDDWNIEASSNIDTRSEVNEADAIRKLDIERRNEAVRRGMG